MNVNSLRDEVRFLFSGQGMPYEKVCLMVAAVVCIVLGLMLSSNFSHDARVVVIDLDDLHALAREFDAVGLQVLEDRAHLLAR